MTPLEERSCIELYANKQYIEDLMGWVTGERIKNPGPGWDAVWEKLERDYARLLQVMQEKSC